MPKTLISAGNKSGRLAPQGVLGKIASTRQVSYSAQHRSPLQTMAAGDAVCKQCAENRHTVVFR